MNRTAITDVDIHPLLKQRHSPYVIDPVRAVSEEDVRALFEAARWTMSSYNAQPWRYIVGIKERDPENWSKIYEILLEGNQPWAANAPVLAIGLAEHNFEHNNKPNKAALHDLGAASAMLTLEATARGLVVHQMIGIDPDKCREVFGISNTLEPVTALAIGYAGDAKHIDATYTDRDNKPRERKPIDTLVIAGGF